MTRALALPDLPPGLHALWVPDEIPARISELLARCDYPDPEDWRDGDGAVLVEREDGLLAGAMTYSVLVRGHWHDAMRTMFPRMPADARVWQIRKYATWAETLKARYRVLCVLVDAALHVGSEQLGLRYAFSAVDTRTYMYPVVVKQFERAGFVRMPSPVAGYQRWGWER